MNIEIGAMKKKVMSAAEKAALQKEWEGKLAKEGLGEIENVAQPVKQNDRVAKAKDRAIVYYLDTHGKQWTMHKNEITYIQNEMRDAGADPQEIQLFDEGFIQQIEDEASEIQLAAHDAYISVLQTNPRLADRHERLQTELTKALKKRLPDYSDKIIRVAAQRFIENSDHLR